MATRSGKLISRRKALQAVAVGAVGAFLEACASVPQTGGTSTSNTSTAATAGTTSVTTAPPSAGAVTLDFWQPFGDIIGKEMDTLVKTWNDKNPNIQVKASFTPNVTSAGSNPKFLAASLGGNPPDIFVHDGSSLSTSAAINAFTPLDDLVKSSGLKPETYFKFAWDKTQWNGKTYALPLNTDARALYTNRKLLKEAGIDKPPTTIDELDAAADKLTKKSGDRFAQLGVIPWIGNWFLVGWGWDFGAKLWDAAQNKISLNAPEMVKALEWEVGYAKKYGVTQLQNFQSGFGSGANDPFIKGQVAMVLTGDWVIANLAQYAPDLEYDITPAPYPTGAHAMTWSGGFVMGIPNGSKHVDAAWKFISWLTSTEAETSFAQAAKVLPCNVDAAKSIAASDPLHKVFIDLLPSAFIEPVIPEWSMAWDQHVAAEQAAILLQKTPQQALDEANAKVQEAIDQRVKGG